jgi:hypothetical protein
MPLRSLPYMFHSLSSVCRILSGLSGGLAFRKIIENEFLGYSE